MAENLRLPLPWTAGVCASLKNPAWVFHGKNQQPKLMMNGKMDAGLKRLPPGRLFHKQEPEGLPQYPEFAIAFINCGRNLLCQLTRIPLLTRP